MHSSFMVFEVFFRVAFSYFYIFLFFILSWFFYVYNRFIFFVLFYSWREDFQHYRRSGDFFLRNFNNLCADCRYKKLANISLQVYYFHHIGSVKNYMRRQRNLICMGEYLISINMIKYVPHGVLKTNSCDA